MPAGNWSKSAEKHSDPGFDTGPLPHIHEKRVGHCSSEYRIPRGTNRPAAAPVHQCSGECLRSESELFIHGNMTHCMAINFNIYDIEEGHHIAKYTAKPAYCAYVCRYALLCVSVGSSEDTKPVKWGRGLSGL